MEMIDVDRLTSHHFHKKSGRVPTKILGTRRRNTKRPRVLDERMFANARAPRILPVDSFALYEKLKVVPRKVILYARDGSYIDRGYSSNIYGTCVPLWIYAKKNVKSFNVDL